MINSTIFIEQIMRRNMLERNKSYKNIVDIVILINEDISFKKVSNSMKKNKKKRIKDTKLFSLNSLYWFMLVYFN